jgi:integrase
LRIDESARNGHAETTKNKKTRVAPLPESLRGELNEWLGTHPHYLFFTSPGGKMLRRNDIYVRGILEATRTAAAIPDLTYRIARTTFASLFEGDEADRTGIMGHHSPAFTLAVYRKPIEERQRGAVEALDRRLKLIPKTKVG